MPKWRGLINEKQLTKGEIRKLTALRKSLGDEIAEDAFATWLSQKETGEAPDPNIELIEKAMQPLIGKMSIPRGSAYAIRRGRGRFIFSRRMSGSRSDTSSWSLSDWQGRSQDSFDDLYLKRRTLSSSSPCRLM